LDLDLKDVPAEVLRQLERDIVRPEGKTAGELAVLGAVAEGVRAAWQSDGQAPVDLPLTERTEGELAQLVARCQGYRDAFAKTDWPAIGEAFNGVLVAIRDERRLRERSAKRRKRKELFDSPEEARAAAADTDWTAPASET